MYGEETHRPLCMFNIIDEYVTQRLQKIQSLPQRFWFDDIAIHVTRSLISSNLTTV